MAGGKQMPAVVVEQIRRGPRGKPRPAHVLFSVAALVTKRGQRAPEDRRAFAVVAGEAEGETVEQQIGGARPTRRRRGGGGGLSQLRYLAAEATGDGRRVERLQVCVSREPSVERGKPAGGIQQQGRSLAAAAEMQGDSPAELLQHRLLELAQWPR